jgi:hypothetical protein
MTKTATEPTPGTIQEAKLEVMRAVEYVQKEYAKGLGYSAAMESKIVHTIRSAMIDAGISMSVLGGSVVSDGEYQTSKGTTMRRVVIERTVRFTHTSGQYEDHHAFGEAADTSDKAFAKAMTIAKKYALREFFLLETGDDPDTERNEFSRKSATKDVLDRATQAALTATSPEALQKILKAAANPKQGLNEAQLDVVRTIVERREAELTKKDLGNGDGSGKESNH